MLDFADTCKHLRVDPSEQRFLTGWVSKYGWFVYQVLFFGIVSGPLLWARVAALVMRFTCALNYEHTDQHTYVDDPLAVTIGTAAVAKQRFAMMILLWRVLGFKLSIKKGAFGQKVAWIGLEFQATDSEVKATIGTKKIEDANVTVKKFMTQTVIASTSLNGGVGYVQKDIVW